MRKSIATVSMSGTLREKLEAIAAARFDGYELFENDLIHFSGSPTAAGAMAADLGLTCELYQPFRDFEGAPDAVFRRSLDRAERKFDVMQAVGAELMLVCSNTSVDVAADDERAAAQLYELAERAAKRSLRIGYEALAWGRAVNRYGQAWSIVKRANHSHLGLILDSFHTLSLRDDPAGIARLPGEKIFFVQLADAHLMDMSVLQWARHFRSFPGQGQFDLVNFVTQVLYRRLHGPHVARDLQRYLSRDAEPAHRQGRDAFAVVPRIPSAFPSRSGSKSRAANPRRRARGRSNGSSCSIPRQRRSSCGIAFLEFGVDERVGSGAWRITPAAGVSPRRKAS